MKLKIEKTNVVFVTQMIFWALNLASCGITKADYVKYAAPTATSSTETSAECTAAQKAFTDNVSPAITSTCAVAGCHTTTTIAGSKLTVGDESGNRKTIKAYTSTDPSKLFNKISKANGQTHSGGDQSGALPLAKITLWTDAEAKCK